MTKSNASAAGAHTEEDEAGLPRPDEHEALDAEIVRDLDADAEASEARGGGCASSHIGVACAAN